MLDLIKLLLPTLKISAIASAINDKIIYLSSYP